MSCTAVQRQQLPTNELYSSAKAAIANQWAVQQCKGSNCQDSIFVNGNAEVSKSSRTKLLQLDEDFKSNIWYQLVMLSL